MKDIIFKFFKKKFILLLIVTGMAGCVFEDDGLGEIPVTPDLDDVTFTVHIPGQQIPTTRSIAGDKGEAAIQFIDLLVFDNNRKLTEHKSGKNISQSQLGTDDYKVTFTAELTANTDARTVVILANVPEATISAVAMEGSLKETVLAVLTVTSTNKWKSDPDNYSPIPMYGEKSVTGITAGGSITDVELTRMLARIDVKNSSTTNFKLKYVHVVNRNSKGYIAPAWGSNGVLLSLLPVAPMVPTGAAQAGYDNKLTYDYNSQLFGDIYVCEAATTSGIEGNESHTNAICLVLEGTYNGQDYYYRVDFTDDTDVDNNPPYKIDGAVNPNFNPSKVKYMPVYRNHLYSFEIIEAEGPGFPLTQEGFEEALNSLGVMNNLKTYLHVVDQSGIKDIVFNGQHFIGLGDEVQFDSEAGLTAIAPCNSNYAGWKIDKIVYDDDDNWLKAEKSGNSIKLSTLLSTVCDRVAHVYVTAGRLTHKLKVTQNGFTLYVGKFAGTLADHNGDGVWYFDEELWIQSCDKTADKWSTTGGLQGVTNDTDGKGNTYNLSTSTEYENPSAKLCYNKNVGKPEKSDMVWYLPAQKQLMGVWVSDNSFSTGKLSSSSSSPIWSSTEYNISNSWTLWFDGTTDGDGKSNKLKVRCVRDY